jgi:hypothetical protein
MKNDLGISRKIMELLEQRFHSFEELREAMPEFTSKQITNALSNLTGKRGGACKKKADNGRLVYGKIQWRPNTKFREFRVLNRSDFNERQALCLMTR